MVVRAGGICCVDAALPSCTASTSLMVMISSIEEVAQVVLQVHHQHRLRGWTLSTELGDSLLLGGGAAPVLVLDRNMHVGGARVPGTSDVGVVFQPRALGDPRACSRRVKVLSALVRTYG